MTERGPHTRASGPGSDLKSQRRSRVERAALSGVASLAGRGLQFATALITVPLTLHYLGTERYGVWLTLLSIAALAGIVDFGIGNSVMNAVARGHGQRDAEGMRGSIANGVLLSCYAALVTGLVMTLAIVAVPAGRLVGAGPAVQDNLKVSLILLAGFMILSLPVAAILRAQDGVQEGFWGAGVQVFSSLLSLVGLVVAIKLNAQLPTLVAAAFVPVLLGNAVCAALFFRRHPDLKPSASAFSAKARGELLGPASAFFVLQITYVAMFSIDPWIGAHLLGPAAVPEFAVPVRLFSMLPMALGLILNPFWPAYREALATDDREWVWRTLRKSVGLTLLVTIPALAVCSLWGVELVSTWTRGGVVPPQKVVVAAALQMAVMSIAIPISALINAIGFLRFQVAFAVLLLCSSLAAKVLLARHVGAAALPASTAASQLLLTVLPTVAALSVWRKRG